MVSFLLSVASRGVAGVLAFVPTFIVTVLSAGAISSALSLGDRKTIANFRRTTAVVLAGGLLWLFCVGCGLLYGWLSASSYALTNAFLFGAFACAGLEFLIINGVFTKSRPLAMVLAALFPAATLTVVRLSELTARTDLLALAFGIVAFAVFAAFTTMLGRKKTGRGFDALQLFQAFMKTWSARNAGDLESAILAHSEEAAVSTKVIRFRTPGGDIFLVLPGVHPGPFHPVGSYDLPGVISRAFEKQGPAMTLHRPGGHERNIATTAGTERFAQEVSAFAQTMATSEGATMKGPLDAKVGKAAVNTMSFSNDLIMTVSFSPLGSDDISFSFEDEIAKIGKESGFDPCVVDAHNSIDHEQESPDLGEPGWKDLITRLSREEPAGFRCAYSHSKEVGFPAGGDLTENGMSLFMLEAHGAKHVLVLADANNAVPPLRAAVAGALGSAGYRLIEFCTSDSHNLAARGLTVARGYHALGEETDVNTIAKLTVDMAKQAESRLSPCAYGSGKVTTNVKIFGTGALEEFAAITQASSKLGRSYLRFAVVSFGVLLLLSLLL
jgi:putative membrane protein